MKQLINKKSGFTLVELLVVVVILSIIVSVVGVSVLRRPDEARQGAAKTQIANFKGAINLYYIHTGKFPTTDQGLKALVEKPDDVEERKWKGPYLDSNKVPSDPWDNEYVYQQPGSEGADYDIICYGKDGVQGGTGYDADITNHNLDEF